MIVDIEREYNNFIRSNWRRLSDSTKDILKFHQKPNYTYNIMSLRSIHFLRLKLRRLEKQKRDKQNSWFRNSSSKNPRHQQRYPNVR